MTMRLLDVRGRPPALSAILPRLFVGEYPRVVDVEAIALRGISAVLSLQDDDDLAAKGIDAAALRDAFRRAGLELLRVPVADNDPLSLARALPALVDRLHGLLEAGHTVLVHCNAGYNRSPTLVIAYLHRHGAMSIEEARAFVKERHTCLPFMTALRRWLEGGRPS